MKRVWPAPERNKAPILEVLRRVLPTQGTVLELASGSGQHAAYFASQLPGLTWIPSDPDPDNLASIRAYVAESGCPNLEEPRTLDVLAPDWGRGPVDGIFCANMIHIAPWECTLALFAGADRILTDAGVLVLYGPFVFDGDFTSESNVGFDDDLRRRDPRWGIRDVRELRRVAATNHFVIDEPIVMPANNHVLVARRS